MAIARSSNAAGRDASPLECQPFIRYSPPGVTVCAAIALVVGAGCTDEVERPAFEVTDSAGVPVALSTEPTRGAGREWRLSQGPTVEVGEEVGADEYLLSQVVGAAWLADGSLLVCNADDRTLRYYDPDGAFLRQSAGAGDGPDELRFLSGCFRRGAETWVYQLPALPIKVFDESGDVVRSVPIPRPGGRVAQLADVTTDGSLLLRQDAPRRDLEMGVSVLSGRVIRAPAGGGRLDTLGVFDTGRWVRGERVAFPAAFSPTLRIVAFGELVIVSWPEAYDLALLDSDGAAVRRIRTSNRPVAVTGTHRRAFQERVLVGPMPAGDTPYQSEEVRRLVVDMMEYPEVLPTHYRVLVSRDDLIWVERGDAPRDPLPQVADPHDPATTWDVFRGSGEWLTTVELPGRFDPLEIGAEHVLGVHHDALGVERVRLYALDRRAEGS